MSLWIILDLAVVAIYVLAILFFKNKGFLKASETVISLVLTMCLMSCALPLFENTIKNSAVGEKIYSGVSEFLIPEKEESTPQEEENKSVLPSFLQEAVDENMKKLDDAKNNMLETTADQTSKVILQIISAILLFVIVKIGIFILFRVLELVCHLKAMKFVNQTLGVILGIVNATIIIYILCAVIVVFVPAEYAAPIKTAMESTYLAQFFYNDNFLMKLFI